MRGKLPIALIAMVLVSACIPQSSAPQPASQGRAPVPTAAAAPAPTDPSLRWQNGQVRPDAREIPATVYLVETGDTLGRIAHETGAGIGAIGAANGIAPPYVIHPGQRLTVPAGRYHEIRAGETGIAIARAYGADWSEVATINGLEEPFVLRVGDRLRLPTEREVASMSRAERAAAFNLDIDDIITGGEPALAANAPVPAERRETPPPTTTARAPTPPVSASTAIPNNATGQFGWPLAGRIVSRFGDNGGGQRNNGLDIAVARGTPVAAAADGSVIYAGNEIQVHGGLILINHGNGWITAYANLDRLDVQRGDTVRRGQRIGATGDTGLAPQPQLHFEIRRNRRPVDPIQHLPSLS